MWFSSQPTFLSLIFSFLWASTGSAREPSTAFCLLLRLLTLRCTEKQMKLLLDHRDSPYIRAMGFLYLRFAGDPKTVWEWIEPYMDDDEPVVVTATANKISHASHRLRDPQTVGDFVKRLFSSELDYYGTMLPRLPLHIERDLQVKLLLAEKIKERAKKHLASRKTMEYFQTLGSRVMALYGDDENPTQWYEAVVDRVITRDEETSQPLATPKFVVTFPAYGNTETVFLGEMEMCGISLDCHSLNEEPAASYRGGVSISDGKHHNARSKHDDHGNFDRDGQGNEKHRFQNTNSIGNRASREDSYRGRGYDRRLDSGSDERTKLPSRSTFGGPAVGAGVLPVESDLYEEVRRRERDSVTTSGNSAIARRPPTAKASLAVPPYRHEKRKVSPHPPPQTSNSFGNRDTSLPHSLPPAAAKKRSVEEDAVIQEKKRKLMAKYG